jgi:hypothetical protein
MLGVHRGRPAAIATLVAVADTDEEEPYERRHA